ncbi:MAG TPA: putative toxin-antitoxin system toxin component, PIN family [Thermomicrobiales bacterium]|nr:putative toxin-antitoxin system toxin component, PIN family [Thermomicrobiales bacterium]
MRVVVDTNVVVSIYLTPTGPSATILNLLESRAFLLLLSPAITAEYDRVMRYPHIRRLHRKSDEEISRFIGRVSRLAVNVVSTQHLNVVADDPNDNKFVECAVEGGAQCIVSGDKHLLHLGSYMDIQILRPAEFTRLFTDEYPAGPF